MTSKWDIVTGRDVARRGRQSAESNPPDPMHGPFIREAASSDGPAITGPPAADAQPQDDWLQRLVKYIPAETIAAYIALDNLAKTLSKVSPHVAEWVVLAGMFVYTWVHMKRVRKVTRSAQIAISLVAFVGWAAGNGGPFESLSFWSPALGSMAVIAVTLIIPLVEPDALPVLSRRDQH